MYHHSYFLAATLDFTSFFTMAFLGPHPFLQLGCFGLDICGRAQLQLHYTMHELVWFHATSVVVSVGRGNTRLSHAFSWSHMCEIHSSGGNPCCERVSFVRMEYSPTLKQVIQRYCRRTNALVNFMPHPSPWGFPHPRWEFDIAFCPHPKGNWNYPIHWSIFAVVAF